MQIKDALAIESQFCALLTKLQRDSGLSQEHFAKRLGVGKHTVYDIVASQKMRSFLTFRKIMEGIIEAYDLPHNTPWPIVDKDLCIVVADNTAGIDPDFCPKCKKVNYHCHCYWQKIK